MNDPKRNLTFGQESVGVNFNPSQNPDVDEAKELSAKLVDLVEKKFSKIIEESRPPTWRTNVLRTAAFNAAVACSMAVVKFLTWDDK